MSAITATEARKNPFGLIQEVNDDHNAVEVVSRHGNAILLSKADYDSMTETAYLLRNPANAQRLLASIERARRGKLVHGRGSAPELREQSSSIQTDGRAMATGGRRIAEPSSASTN